MAASPLANAPAEQQSIMYHAHTLLQLLLRVLVPHSARMSIPHLALNITVWVWLRDHDLTSGAAVHMVYTVFELTLCDGFMMYA